MKIKDIARNYNLPVNQLSVFLKNSDKYRTTTSAFGGLLVEDSVVPEIIADFQAEVKKQVQTQEERQRTAALAELERIQTVKQAADNKKRALAGMLITSGFNFDGYTVVKYSGYISGDDAVQIDRGREGIFHSATNVGDALMGSLTAIRRNALAELKEQAFALGCNAIIGVDFDYLTLDPETVNSNGGTLYMPYVFGVTANGNAVIIEKNKQY
ncbi:heavy metal-binding domain-containing protein [Loigolactobacillus binensis]|uniref:Heavy metal-binding domain-containing protein n=1 Tax=Loigolactobacillus binensis TaxID=2559922 RepID=A0ABW3EBP8_9LACO|nr:heavy metal-binding domain-containing protein [Loigolactobacillus binensis]